MRIAPGAFVILIAAILIGICVIYKTPFDMEMKPAETTSPQLNTYNYEINRSLENEEMP